MKKILLLLLFVVITFIIYKVISKDKYDDKEVIPRIDAQLNEIRKVINSDSKYNKDIAFFIDMRIPSGKNRFFVYDLNADKIIDKGLVAHGSGSETGD